MALPGELLGEETITCTDCESKLPLMVCRSGAGYYLGHFCPMCGPYGRSSLYFETREEAEKALKTNDWARR